MDDQILIAVGIQIHPLEMLVTPSTRVCILDGKRQPPFRFLCPNVIDQGVKRVVIFQATSTVILDVDRTHEIRPAVSIHVHRLGQEMKLRVIVIRFGI